MEIENANSHPFKVAITKDGDKMYANSHPYKVEVVEGGSSTELATELPEIGEEGTTYVLVDDAENPTKVYGTYIYQNGWILVSQPVDQAVQKVTELPETGEEGVLYYLEKEGEEDTYDLYRWINDEWIKVDTDIKLYDSTGTNTDGAMTQNAVTSMIFADPANCKRIKITTGTLNGVSDDGEIAIGSGTQQTTGRGIGIGQSIINYATGGIAIGQNANTSSSSAYSVALGAGAKTTQKGEVNIGTGIQSSWGYNSSNYRLLTGVYDGQSDHDAATFGQVVSYSAINGAGAPTTATEGKYVGQLYYDTTNEDMYFLKAIDTTTDPATYTWKGLGGGGSGATELTSADYNWPTSGTPTSVALWLLEPGMYKWDEVAVSINSAFPKFGYSGFAWVSDTQNYMIEILAAFTDNTVYSYTVASTYGNAIHGGELLTGEKIVQTTGTSTTNVMSQNATTSMVYADPSTKQKIQLGGTAAGTQSISIGASSIASSLKSISLGASAVASASQGVAIGERATVSSNGDGAIALGTESSSAGIGSVAFSWGTASAKGEFSVGTGGWPTGGYNDSAYRLITGVYDPQSAHDAATKGYVDTAVAEAGASTISSQDWSDLWQ